MKKRILSAVLAALMLASAGSVFADTEAVNTETTEITEAPVFQQQYVPVSNIVKTVTENKNFKAVIECENEENGTIFFNVSENALIVNNKGERVNVEDIKAGVSITAYTNIYTPTLMIYPPQYTSEVIVVNSEETGMTDVDKYSEELVNAGNTLALNINDSVVIEFASGIKKIASKEDLQNADLAVFYENSTRSIPAQTTPSKVIILDNIRKDENIEIADENMPVDDNMEVTPESFAVVTVNGNAVDAHMIMNEGKILLPIRVVAEAMGLEVKWDDGLKAISVGTVPMGVHFTIGNDEYYKARMMPQSLGQAPMLVEFDNTGVTYVPVNFFSDILGAEVTEDENTGSIAITYNVN